MPADSASIMRLIADCKDSTFAIPVNRIDWIKSEDSSGGRVLVKIGTGGVEHHYNFDTKEEAKQFYDEVIRDLEEL